MPVYYGSIPQFPPGSGPIGMDRARNNSAGLGSALEQGSRYSLPGLLARLFQPTGGRITGGGGIAERVRQSPMGSIGSGLNSTRPPSIADILQKLESLQDPSRFTPPMELLEAQARARAGAQYDPIIARLRNQMGVAEGRANRNREALGTMFNQLSSSIGGEIPGIQQQFAGAEKRTADQYAGLKQGIQDQYSKSQQEQEAMMQRLNIQAAAPDALQQQGIDRDYFTNQASQNAQVQQDALGQEERGAVDYTRRGSQMAQVEGTNRQADLMFQLQDLLAQYEGQIGEAEIGKNQTYLEALTGLQNDSSKQAMDQAQRQFENYIKVLNVGQMLQKGQNGGIGSVQSPADVGQRVLGMGLDPNSAQAVQSVFMSAIGSDPMIQAGIDPNFGQALPKEALAARVVEAGRQAGLNESALNALQVAALEYFGRR